MVLVLSPVNQLWSFCFALAEISVRSPSSALAPFVNLSVWQQQQQQQGASLVLEPSLQTWGSRTPSFPSVSSTLISLGG